MRDEYVFYDSKYAVTAPELQDLYRYTGWGRSRSVEGIQAMLEGTSICFSARHQDKLVGFCRMITDFVYRATLWDVIVHPAHQGKGLGSSLRAEPPRHPRHPHDPDLHQRVGVLHGVPRIRAPKRGNAAALSDRIFLIKYS